MDAETMNELRRRAEAATPGPWSEFCESGDWWVAQTLAGGEPGESVLDSSPNAMLQADVDFICAANPTATLSLIAHVDELTAVLKDVRAIIADVQDGIPWQVAADSALLRLEAALGEVAK